MGAGSQGGSRSRSRRQTRPSWAGAAHAAAGQVTWWSPSWQSAADAARGRPRPQPPRVAPPRVPVPGPSTLCCSASPARSAWGCVPHVTDQHRCGAWALSSKQTMWCCGVGLVAAFRVPRHPPAGAPARTDHLCSAQPASSVCLRHFVAYPSQAAGSRPDRVVCNIETTGRARSRIFAFSRCRDIACWRSCRGLGFLCLRRVSLVGPLLLLPEACFAVSGRWSTSIPVSRAPVPTAISGMLIAAVGGSCAGTSLLASYLVFREDFVPVGVLWPQQQEQQQEQRNLPLTAPAPVDPPTARTHCPLAPIPPSSPPSRALEEKTILHAGSRARGSGPPTPSAQETVLFPDPETLLDHVTGHWQNRFVLVDDVMVPPPPSVQGSSSAASRSEAESQSRARTRAPRLARFDDLQAATQAAFRKRPFFLLVGVQAPTSARWERYRLRAQAGASQQAAMNQAADPSSMCHAHAAHLQGRADTSASASASASARCEAAGADLTSWLAWDDERMYSRSPTLLPKWGVVRTKRLPCSDATPGLGEHMPPAGPLQRPASERRGGGDSALHAEIRDQTNFWADDTRAQVAGPGLLGLLDSADVTLVNVSPHAGAFEWVCGSAGLASGDRLRPPWDSYFLSLCTLAAARSNCMKRRVGCVLVRDKRVLATGYNGTPRGVRNCNEGGCARCNGSARMGAGLTECLCLHAEENALLECGREKGGAAGTVLYCNTYVRDRTRWPGRLADMQTLIFFCFFFRFFFFFASSFLSGQVPLPAVRSEDRAGGREGGGVRAGVRDGQPLGGALCRVRHCLPAVPAGRVACGRMAHTRLAGHSADTAHAFVFLRRTRGRAIVSGAAHFCPPAVRMRRRVSQGCYVMHEQGREGSAAVSRASPPRTGGMLFFFCFSASCLCFFPLFFSCPLARGRRERARDSAAVT